MFDSFIIKLILYILNLDLIDLLIFFYIAFSFNKWSISFKNLIHND